jgi:AraC-like DNA-binding protein
MAAMDGDDDQEPAHSMDPEGDPRLSIELLMGELGLSIEELTRQLVDQASVIMSAQERLRRLLHANRSIVQELSLPATSRSLL